LFMRHALPVIAAPANAARLTNSGGERMISPTFTTPNHDIVED